MKIINPYFRRRVVVRLPRVLAADCQGANRRGGMVVPLLFLLLSFDVRWRISTQPGLAGRVSLILVEGDPAEPASAPPVAGHVSQLDVCPTGSDVTVTSGSIEWLVPHWKWINAPLVFEGVHAIQCVLWGIVEAEENVYLDLLLGMSAFLNVWIAVAT